MPYVIIRYVILATHRRMMPVYVPFPRRHIAGF